MKKNNPWYYIVYDEKLVKEKKPCMPDDFVHLKNMEGCFRVIDVYLKYFTIMKDREIKKIYWDNFRCLKGEGSGYYREVKKLNKLKNNFNNTQNFNEIIETQKRVSAYKVIYNWKPDKEHIKSVILE